LQITLQTSTNTPSQSIMNDLNNGLRVSEFEYQDLWLPLDFANETHSQRREDFEPPNGVALLGGAFSLGFTLTFIITFWLTRRQERRRVRREARRARRAARRVRREERIRQ
jgi:hypothetical protein